jgi:LytS/YehU family sensor histidine kinase
MQVDDACSECQVPPLVLQPLIENAIKHGIATMVDGGIVRLEGHVENGNLAVRVENSFDPEAPSPRRHGLGLRNVRSRLQTRFGDAAHLHLAAEHDRFSAEMVFPCHRINS